MNLKSNKNNLKSIVLGKYGSHHLLVGGGEEGLKGAIK
jgi:hypothetical protein